MDSPLEEEGFELVVPASKRTTVPRARRSSSALAARVLISENNDFEFPAPEVTSVVDPREPVLLHAARPPQLSRPGHRPSDSRRSSAARFDRGQAAGALTSTTCLARTTVRAGFLPEPDLNSLSHRLIDAAVLEFGPTEIFPPVGAMHRAIPVSADRGALSGPHARAKSRLLAVGGQNCARRGLSAGGRWIRTISPAAGRDWPFSRPP